MHKNTKPYWQERADRYRDLADSTRDPDLRQAVDHLARVCTDMANAVEPSDGVPKTPAWIDVPDIPREARAQRWRIRAAEYIAIAETCATDDGAYSWRSLAAHCAEIAKFLESRS
jgi:hypothetical protein